MDTLTSAIHTAKCGPSGVRARRMDRPPDGARPPLTVFDPDDGTEPPGDDPPPEAPPRWPGGFAKIPHAMISDGVLTGMEVHVYAVLLRHSRQKGVCNPSNETIGKELPPRVGENARHPDHISRVLRSI